MAWDQAFLTYIELVSCGKESSKLRATVEVSRLAPDAPDHLLPLIPQILVDLLVTSRPPQIQEAAVFALHRIARRANGSLCPVIGEAGAVPSLLRLLPLSADRFRRILIRCLRTVLDFDNASRMVAARNGGLEAVLQLLPSSAGCCRRQLLEILGMLATLREVRRGSINLGGLSYLVEAVSCGRIAARTRAAHAIGFLGTARRVGHICSSTWAL